MCVVVMYHNIMHIELNISENSTECLNHARLLPAIILSLLFTTFSHSTRSHSLIVLMCFLRVAF